MENQGYIKLHRKITNHWLYPANKKEAFTEFEAWQDLLLNVNFSEQKVRVKNQLIVCEPGETVRSLINWSDRWNWSKSKVLRFFRLLEKDGMISLKSETVTTRIKVCNWETYQTERNGNETQSNRNRTAIEPQSNTNNKVKKDNNVKKLVSKLSLTEREQKFYDELKTYHPKYPKETLRAFYDYWTEPNRSNTKMRFELEKTWSTKRRLSTWASREKPTAQAPQKPPTGYSHIERWKPEDDQIDPQFEKELLKNIKSL